MGVTGSRGEGEWLKNRGGGSYEIIDSPSEKSSTTTKFLLQQVRRMKLDMRHLTLRNLSDRESLQILEEGLSGSEILTFLEFYSIQAKFATKRDQIALRRFFSLLPALRHLVVRRPSYNYGEDISDLVSAACEESNITNLTISVAQALPLSTMKSMFSSDSLSCVVINVTVSTHDAYILKLLFKAENLKIIRMSEISEMSLLKALPRNHESFDFDKPSHEFSFALCVNDSHSGIVGLFPRLGNCKCRKIYIRKRPGASNLAINKSVASAIERRAATLNPITLLWNLPPHLSAYIRKVVPDASFPGVR